MFLLRTFGGLELTTESGDAVAGAAGQRKPLLILALAALVPGGIPRDRLLRALWPGIDRTRARATLKQHLYALRRATGNPNLVTGSPRLRIAADAVRVDAIEFAECVERGHLREAAQLLRGELLEEVGEPAGELLIALVAEIREAFAAKVMLVRKSVAVQRALPLTGPVHSQLSTLSAERELAAAARRFVRGMIALPADAIAARHRAAANNHDLTEALGAAENAGVAPAQIREHLVDVEPFWQRSELVRQMQGAPLGQAGSVATLEWLLDGGIRSTDPIGQALEAHLLDCGVTAQFRARADWEQRELARAFAGPDCCNPNVLVFGPRGGRELGAIGAAVRCAAASVVVSDADEESAALARLRLVALGDRVTVVAGDPFARLDQFADLGPFDLILTGTLLDHLAARHGTWLTEHLLRILAPAGRLCLSSLPADDPYGAWLRHIANWNPVERDQDDIVLLTGAAADQCDMSWERDAAGSVWLVSLQRRSGQPSRAAQAAA